VISLDESDQLLAAKVAFAMRLARTALNMSQAEFGEMMGVSKPTIVRIENLETPVKLAFYSKMVKLLAIRGLRVDAITPEGVSVDANEAAVLRLVRQIEEGKAKRSRKSRQEVSKKTKGGSDPQSGQ